MKEIMIFSFKKISGPVLLGLWTLLLQAEPLPEKDALREKASGGNAESAFYLGNEYFYGENRAQNYTLAAYWYRKAAEKGIPEAQFNYASCLESGRGVKTNLPDAFAWYKKAADQQFAPAVFRIAQFYVTGVQGEKGPLLMPDRTTALQLLEQLVERQYEPAELELAAMQIGKNNSAEDHRQGFALLTRITGRGNQCPAAAFRMLADCYFAGLGCKPDRQKATDLLKTAAGKGDAEALAKLGFLYEYGQAVRQDLPRAQEYYRKAAEAGHPMAQFKYAEALAEGVYPGKNIHDAIPWYQKSARGGCAQAFFKLGVFYHDGLAVQQDKKRAARLFLQAAKMGYVHAQYNLGCLFNEGAITGKPDREAAFYWFLQAAKNGNTAAQKRVAECYLKGIGVDRSISNAEKWLQMAAQGGDITARRLLYEIQRSVPDGPFF